MRISTDYRYDNNGEDWSVANLYLSEKEIADYGLKPNNYNGLQYDHITLPERDSGANPDEHLVMSFGGKLSEICMEKGVANSTTQTKAYYGLEGWEKSPFEGDTEFLPSELRKKLQFAIENKYGTYNKNYFEKPIFDGKKWTEGDLEKALERRQNEKNENSVKQSKNVPKFSSHKDLQKYLFNAKNKNNFLNNINTYTISQKIGNHPIKSSSDVKKLLDNIDNNTIKFSESEEILKISLRQTCNEYLSNDNKKLFNNFKNSLEKNIKNNFLLYQYPFENFYLENISKINNKKIVKYDLKKIDDDFLWDSNKRFLESIENGSNPLLNPSQFPVIAKHAETGMPLEGINQLNALSGMSADKVPSVYFINYNYIAKDKSNWIKNLDNEFQSKFKKGKGLIKVLYKGKDPKTGERKYELTVPASRLNQAELSNTESIPNNNIAINQSFPNQNLSDQNFKPITLNTPQDAQKFFTDNYANYFNSNLNTIPFTPIEYKGNLAATTAQMLDNDPQILYKIACNAVSQALSRRDDMNLQNNIPSNTILPDNNNKNENIKTISLSPEIKNNLNNTVLNLYNKLKDNNIKSPLLNLLDKQAEFFNHPVNKNTIDDHMNYLIGDKIDLNTLNRINNLVISTQKQLSNNINKNNIKNIEI
jgi:hypothetical protein